MCRLRQVLMVQIALNKQLQLHNKNLWGDSAGLATLIFKAFGKVFRGLYTRETCPESHRALQTVQADKANSRGSWDSLI